MSKKEGKDIDLIVKGKEIELDRLVMDDINDVVVHLLRNAIDHGIETPEQRAQVGKKRGGTIKLIARREGDYVIIEVSDDGKGIDTEAVKKAAVEKEFITEDEASKLSTEEVFGLLGASGLSTLKEATEFSGRGVGFDVVKSKINSLGGTVRVQSEKNVGTKVTLKLPLTTAIIQSLMVVVGGETYAVPLGSVQEVVAIGKDDLKTIQRREIIKHRGKVVPVLRLRDLLGAPSERKIGPTIIVERGEEAVGLMVDSIAGQQKTVVKPLAGVLEGRKEFAGATILPNGRVALILDVPGLVG
jgi:two-component system chemotaxis sensor kinase CheA